MKLRLNRNQRRSLEAFTLIELLVVLVIIAALAALVIPNIGMFGRSTDMAVSAKTQSDIASQIQMFFVTQKRYPDGLDSLITTDGEIYKSDNSDRDLQTRGLPIAGADDSNLESQLTVSTLSGSFLRSVDRSGILRVFDHATSAGNSNTSNTSSRIFKSDAKVAEVIVPSGLAADKAILNKLVPEGLKGNERLIAFGFGQKNTAIGKTTVTCPLYPGADKNYYGRYIVYFKIYASGERATLVGVSDSYGRTPDYTQQQFNESLPDGARQG